MAMATLASPPSNLRDPVARERALWLLAAIAVLVPAGWLVEFNPATLWGAPSLRATSQFLGTFFPPRIDGEFLVLVAAPRGRRLPSRRSAPRSRC